MKKRFKRWLVVMVSIIMALSTSIASLAAMDGTRSVSNTQVAYIKKTDASMNMFVNNASVKVITYDDGKKEAVFTYIRSTNTYPKVFLGTVDEANAADAVSDTSKVYEAVAVDGGYQYTIPLEALDTEFALSLYSSSQNSWRPNTLIVTLSDPSQAPEDSGNTGEGSTVVFQDGTYEGVGSVPGGKYPTVGYDISVLVDIKDGKISTVKYKDALPNDGNISYKKWVIDGQYLYDEESKIWSFIKGIAEQLVGKTSTTGIDAVTGATKTSNAVLEGVNAALEKAKNGETATVPTPPTVHEKADVIAKTGIYTVDVDCNGITIIDAELTSKNETMTALVTFSGTGYDLLYFGTEAEAMAAGEDSLIQYCGTKEYVNASGVTKTGCQFEIPVASLDKDIAFISHAKSTNKWFYRTINFDSDSLIKIGEPTADDPGTNPDPGTPDQPDDTEIILPDGTYSVNVETGNTMFKVVDCKLVVKGEKVSALVTLSSNGYDYLYVGTASQAEAAGSSAWSKWVKEIPAGDKTQRMYQIEITKNALKDGLSLVAHSTKNDTWYDRTLTFAVDSLKVYSVGTSVEDAINNVVSDKVNTGNNNGSTGGSTGTTTDKEDNTLTQDEIKDKLNNVDTESTVKDGTYTPSFGFEGGSGRATISCNKVVVKNGKATATIVFSSPNFTWVKTAGKTYYNENKGGNSTFTIPITLNGKTAISAETTAMSQPHVVDYTLYCFIDGTKVTTKGSTSDETIELEGAATTTDGTDTDTEADPNSWGDFDSGEDAVTWSATGADTAQNYQAVIKVLTTALVLVCIYGAAGTVFAAVKFRRMKGE